MGEKVSIKATAFDASAQDHHFRGCADRRTNPHGQGSRGLGQSQGAWRPGLFVNVEVIASETAVPVSVASDAIQSVGTSRSFSSR